jgi:hypothetical protein
MKPFRALFLGKAAYAMAWWAVFLGVVGVPLAALTIDGTRALYVRTHLQTATDAACEAAAQALDVPFFMATGRARIQLSTARGWAGREFSSSVIDQGIVLYSPALTSMTLLTPTIVRCTASAALDPLVQGFPRLEAQVASVSEVRVGRR